jgi:integrase
MEIEIPTPEDNIHVIQDDLGSFENLPDRDDIKRALNYATPKYRAIILLMLSSGMGRSEILSLTI